jgi:hypothetical protein
MLILDGKPLSYDRAFTHDGIQYPANWLRLTSLKEKEAIGISEVADPPYYDQRFYWGVGNPKDHTQLVEQWVSTTNQTAYTLLLPTDWYIVRKTETDVAVPQDVLDRRTEIRSYCDEKRDAINATETTDELAVYITSAAYSQWEDVPEPEPQPDPEIPIASGGVVSGGFVSMGGEDTVIL